MKNIKVKAIRFFKDKVEKVDRNIDDEFLVDKKRYDFLKSNNAVELIGVLTGVIKESEETGKSVDEVIDNIVDEVVESEEVKNAIDEVADVVVDNLFKKKGKKKNK